VDSDFHSTTLQEGDEVVAIDGDACCGGEFAHGGGGPDICKIRDALRGPPWSRVMLSGEKSSEVSTGK